jgi:hypothetical protein
MNTNKKLRKSLNYGTGAITSVPTTQVIVFTRRRGGKRGAWEGSERRRIGPGKILSRLAEGSWTWKLFNCKYTANFDNAGYYILVCGQTT